MIISKEFSTYDFIMLFSAFLRSLATNQSIKKAAILGAEVYNLKKAWKLPNHHAERTFNACIMHSSFLSSVDKAAKMVVKSITKILIVLISIYKKYCIVKLYKIIKNLEYFSWKYNIIFYMQ